MGFEPQWRNNRTADIQVGDGGDGALLMFRLAVAIQHQNEISSVAGAKLNAPRQGHVKRIKVIRNNQADYFGAATVEIDGEDVRTKAGILQSSINLQARFLAHRFRILKKFGHSWPGDPNGNGKFLHSSYFFRRHTGTCFMFMRPDT